jgi:MFS family permease
MRDAPRTAAAAGLEGRPTLLPIAAAFVGFGAFWGSWSIAAADVEHELRISHGTFGLILSLGLAAAGLANVLGGVLAERHGTARVLSFALLVWAALLAGAALAQPRLLLISLIVATFAVGGVVDTVMNVSATAALANQPGHLVRFHALFNIGAAVGALGTGLLVSNDHSWRWWWGLVAVTAVAIAYLCTRVVLPAGERGENIPLGGAFRLLRAEKLVLVATAFAVGAMVEGGVDLWGVLYLRTELSSGLAVGVTSAVIAYVVAALARIVFGPTVGRHGAARGVAIGASTAAVGIVMLTLLPGAWLRGLGLVVAAGGISMCWPLLLAHATAGKERPGTIVGAVTAVGYLGLFAGPTMVGWIATGVSLQAGLLALAGAAVFVAIAPNLPARRER